MNLSIAITELSIILKFEQPTQGHGTSDVQAVCENTLAALNRKSYIEVTLSLILGLDDRESWLSAFCNGVHFTVCCK